MIKMTGESQYMSIKNVKYFNEDYNEMESDKHLHFEQFSSEQYFEEMRKYFKDAIEDLKTTRNSQKIFSILGRNFEYNKIHAAVEKEIHT